MAVAFCVCVCACLCVCVLAHTNDPGLESDLETTVLPTSGYQSDLLL